MSYFFINETKKQVVSCKKLYGDFEDSPQLLSYLSLCVGDTIRISNNEDEELGGYEFIKLCSYRIKEDRYDCIEFERLINDVYDREHR
jgi:hypothetical protein